jgi:eukaryotic-like serine/threonine-protein kinase
LREHHDALLQRTEATLTLAPKSSSAASLVGDVPAEAMRLAEVGRVRVFSAVMIAFGVMGLFMIPLLGGDPLAKRLFQVVPAVVIGLGFVLLATTRVPDRYRDWHLAAVSLTVVPLTLAPLYYFGVFSPFPIIAALGIYMYSQSQNRGYAAANYALQTGGHALLAAGILSGFIRDRGLITAGDLPLRDQITIQVAVVLTLTMAFILGRASRAKALYATQELQAAVRRAAHQEALAQEARAQLERVRIGGPGRHTDQVYGSFRLGNLIGRGAMGEVYQAVHLQTGEPAAVKLLFPNVLSQPDHVARFLREARAAGSLQVANVVRVLEAPDPDAAVPYLAMEWLNGRDLAYELRERGRLPPSEVHELAEHVAAALEAARAASIVHRDLKPHNIIRHQGDYGYVWKVLDFGASKLLDGDDSLTQGHLVGTPAYMAPEQARGEDVDHRADLFALAAITYRALTGNPLYRSRDIPALLYDVVHTMPERPGAIVQLPADVDLVLAVGLAKAKSDRFDSAGEFARCLARALDGRLDDRTRVRAHALLAQRPWTPPPNLAVA